MDPGLVTAGLGLAGSALGFWGQERANAQNLKIARERMSFEERMSNTSWQRGVADMRAAGINPLLSVSKGGASTPSGASATMENSMSAGVSSGMAALRAREEVNLLRAQVKKTEAEGQTAAEAALAAAIQNTLWSGRSASGSFSVGGDPTFQAWNLKKLIQDVDTGGASARQLRSSATLNEITSELRNIRDRPEAEAWGRFYRSSVGRNLPFVRSGAQGVKAALLGELLEVMPSLRWVPREVRDAVERAVPRR